MIGGGDQLVVVEIVGGIQRYLTVAGTQVSQIRLDFEV